MQFELEDIAALFIGLSFLHWALATLCFGRITVRYLDRELLAQGLDMAEADPLRLPAYALVLLSNQPERHHFVPGREIKRLGRSKDILLARWEFWSSLFFFIPSVVCFLWLKGWLWF